MESQWGMNCSLAFLALVLFCSLLSYFGAEASGPKNSRPCVVAKRTK